jgi:hypothetical protein
MRKTLAILLTSLTLVSATTAHADDWRRYGHREYRGGGGGGNWVAPLVGGLIVGGILGSMAEQNQQQYQQYQPQTFCRMVPVYDAWGNFVGRQRQCWQQ